MEQSTHENTEVQEWSQPTVELVKPQWSLVLRSIPLSSASSCLVIAVHLPPSATLVADVQ